MASPEMFPSAPRQSNRVYSELPHLHREISHLLGDPDSDDENLPGYEELERRGMIQISTHSSVPGTTRDQPGSKQEEEDHFPAVWYRRSSEGPKDHRAPEEHSSTDV